METMIANTAENRSHAFQMEEESPVWRQKLHYLNCEDGMHGMI